MKKLIVLVVLGFSFHSSIYSQIFGAPDPCTDGSEDTCECDTAPILCTLNDLDGYEYDMDTYEHPEDGPDPMCPPPDGNFTTSHNPTWFAFISWCEEITIEVTATDCVDGPACGGSMNFGIQIGVYEDCSLDPNSAIACGTDVAGCEDDYTRVLDITGMDVGSTYYFLVDGCCSSACHVAIEIIGQCSQSEMGPWEQEIQGACVVCPDELTQTYEIDAHPGAVNYYWELDGVEVGTASQPALIETITFPGPGEYELCIDVDNKPCILVQDSPEPLCKTITVLNFSADSGELTADTSPACPSETITITVPGWTDDPDFDQWLILTDAAGDIIEAIESDTEDYSFDECITYTVHSYNYYNDSTFTVPVIGENVNDFALCDDCFCEITELDLVWEDLEAPTFPSPPMDTTVTCLDDLEAIGEIDFDDNCLDSDVVLGIEDGSATLCDGGTFTRTWTVIDSCDNESTHTQVVTVDPIPEAVFINTPDNDTLSCADLLDGEVPLEYTNSSTANCLIEGTVIGTTNDFLDICGGDLTYTWEFTDECMRTITHTQIVTIEPPLEVFFMDVPVDVTITCDDLPFTPVNLDYSNEDTGDCLYTGTDVVPTSSGMLDICGDQITYTWSFTDECNRTFDTIQVVTLEDTENPTFTSPPGNETYDCYSEVPAAMEIEWMDNCDGAGLVSATETGTIDNCTGGSITRTWTYMDDCGLSVSHDQIITVNARPDVVWLTALPTDIDVVCGEALPANLDLEYSNSAVDLCLQTGFAPMVQTGMHDVCGDVITRSWEFIPDCGPTITHTQTITLIDTENPVFVDPPGNLTFDCYSEVLPGSDLTWTDNCDGTGEAMLMESGVIDECTGGDITRTWEYTDACGLSVSHTQTITVNPRPDIDWTDTPPTDIDVVCGEILPSLDPLDYSNMGIDLCLESGTAIPTETGQLDVCGDVITRTWEIVPACGPTLTHTQTITLVDTENPVFTAPPQNLTFDCFSEVPSIEDLEWTDNCDGTGMVTGTETGAIDNCDGGTLTRTWMYTDACGLEVNHTQTITVNPRPDIEWTTALPMDFDVICDEVFDAAIDLDFTNNGVDVCLEDGTVVATEVGDLVVCGDEIVRTWEFIPECGPTLTHTQTITLIDTEFPVLLDPPAGITLDCYLDVPSGEDLDWTDNCDGTGTVSYSETGAINDCEGGSITRTWTYTDMCGNETNHEQVIVVDPTPLPEFVNPPADLTVNCSSVPATAPDLMYTNSESNNCLISGSVTASMTGGYDVCGGAVSFSWEYTDDCGRTIQHTQNVTVEAAGIASFTSLPADITVECSDTPTSFSDLEYDNGENGVCAIAGSVPAMQQGTVDECGGELTIVWVFTDDCGRMIDHQQIITVNPAPAAAFTSSPQDLTVACIDLPTDPPFLDYTNSETGDCAIEGSLQASQSGTSTECGGTVTYEWVFTDDCGRTISEQQVYTVEPSQPAEFLNAPSDITINCEQLPYSAPSLDYSNGESGKCLIEGTVTPSESGQADECGGFLTYTWQFTDDCNRNIIWVQNVVVEPSEQAMYIDPPADITVSCTEGENAVQPLFYENSQSGLCGISGQSPPNVTGSYDLCGGELFVLWEFTDNCNRTIQEEQIIIIEPAPEAEFIDPPADITINCDEVTTALPTLDYSNDLTGTCEIAGTVTAISSGFYDTCGGLLTYSWVYIDDCNRTIIAEQDITVLPAPNPEFTGVPNDLTINCGDPDYIPVPLFYSNNETGICEISGDADPVLSATNNIFTYTWTYENPCNGQTVEVSQEVTNFIEPDIFVIPATVTICSGDSYDLLDLLIEDLNTTTITYTFHSAFPTNVTNELGSTIVSPTAQTIYYVSAINEFFCEDFELFTIEVDQPVSAGDNGSGSLCNDENSIDLFNYLNNVTDLSGDWTPPPGSNIDVSTPSSVDFVGVAPGIYEFEYTIPSENSCPPSSAFATIEVYQSIEINLDNIECSMDQDFYTINIVVNDADVSATGGTVIDLGGGNWSIADIPISQSVTITAVNTTTQCSDELIVNPPNCDCPDVMPPTADPVPTICGVDSPIELMVNVGPDETANWYSDPMGNNLLQGESLSFTFTETAAGTYTYYVETQSTIFPDCVSLTLTEVTVEIAPNPMVQNASLFLCDDDQDGFVEFDLAAAENDIGGTNNYTYSYHLTEAEAMNGSNPLGTSFTNTTANMQTIFVQSTSTFGCISVSELSLVVWELPQFNIEISPETCENSSDGYIIPNPSGGNGITEVSIDGISYAVVDSFTNLSAGDYTLYGIDENGCTIMQNFTIDPGLLLSLDLINVACSSNDTDTDPLDDFYEITFNIGNNLGITGQFNLYIDGNLNNAYAYGADHTITLPADGSVLILTFEDVVNGCTLENTIGPLNPCSTDCDITIDVLTFICDGNETPSDPSDDFYTVTLNASADNGSTTNTYNVFIDGVLTFNYMYGNQEQFILPADGTTKAILIVDNEDDQCQENGSIGPLVSCSDLCVLTLGNITTPCENQGTENDVDDDTYTIEFSVTGSNISGGWVSDNGLYSGNYNENIVLGPFLISAGDVNFEIIDSDDANCTISFNATAPAPCSAPCVIEMIELLIGECQDNNTGTIDTDDFFSFEFIITNTEGMTNQFIVEFNGLTFGPYNYGELITIPSIPADGSLLDIVVTDITFGQCLTDFNVQSPESCSSCNQTVEAGNDVLLDCTNTSTVLFAMPSETAMFTWTGPNFFFSDQQDPVVGSPGIYVVVATFDDGCMATDSLEISVDDDIPIANAGPDQFITCDTDEVTLEAIVSDLENIEIIWTDENGDVISNDLSFTTDIIGSYFLQLIDTLNNCNSAIDEVLVMENTQDPIAVIFANPGNQIDCVIASIEMSNEVEEGVVYQWFFEGVASDAVPLIITDSGLIELFALDTINGCTNQASLQIVDIQDYPIAMINPADTIDCINDMVELSAFESPLNSNVIYIWYDTDSNPIGFDQVTTIVNMGGEYILEAIDTSNNCANFDTVFVESLIEEPELEAGPDQYLGCGIVLSTINPTLPGDPSIFDIGWMTNSGSILSSTSELSIDIEGSGAYIITVLNTITSCEVSDTVNVYTTDGLSTSIVDAQNISCFGENDGFILIDMVVGGEQPYMYSINNGPFTDNPNFNNLGPGTYALEIEDVNGCSLDTSFVLIEPDEISLIISPDVNITVGESTDLLGEIDFPIDQIGSISWSPTTGLSCTDCLDPIATPETNTSYTLTVTDLNGCSVSATVFIAVEQIGISTFIPNIFSPNGDNNGNDGFTFYGDENVELIEKMLIYDRWGELIFSAENIEPNNPAVGWDGRFKNRAVLEGVYVYKFDILFKDMTREVYAGDITVIR